MSSGTVERQKKRRGPPKKKVRNLSPASQQRHELELLLAKPDQEIPLVWKEKKLEPLPPDILLNIQGSSAGAGSGEFHVYKAARKREYERIRNFEMEIEREESEKEFLRERAARERSLAEKTAKNRRKREKKKGKKADEEDGDTGHKLGLKIDLKNALDEETGNDDENEVHDGLLVVEDDL